MPISELSCSKRKEEEAQDKLALFYLKYTILRTKYQMTKLFKWA